MNKVILMGRLTRDPETRYTQSEEPMAITRYALAIDRRFRKEGEANADFINCVAFGKGGEFVDKWFKKGQMVSVVGRIQNSSWNDKETGEKKYRTEVITDEHFFAESKASFESRKASRDDIPPDDIYSIPPATKTKAEDFADMEVDDDDLPF